jgi:hypothetical protein
MKGTPVAFVFKASTEDITHRYPVFAECYEAVNRFIAAMRLKGVHACKTA